MEVHKCTLSYHFKNLACVLASFFLPYIFRYFVYTKVEQY